MSTTTLTTTQYITSQGELNLLEYKYSGSDSSYFYKYVHSPLAEFIVARLPRWLAPNVITLLAFSHSLLAYVLINGETVEPWKWVLSGYLYWTYAVLDNMDGKQARRLQASSPLGLVLDHGCDALVTVMMSINMQKILAFDPVSEVHWILLSFLLPVIIFFFATWEELMIGSLDLPVVGVNEANLFAIATHWMQAYKPGYMTTTVVGGVDVVVNRVVIIGFLILGIIVILNSILNVRRGGCNVGQGLLLTIPFWLTLTVGLGWTVVTRGDRLHIVFWLVGLSFSKLVTHMQIAHVAKDSFQPWRKTLLLPVALFAGNFFLAHSLWLTAALVVAGVSWVHMAYFTVTQMMRALNIPFLTVPKNRTTTTAVVATNGTRGVATGVVNGVVTQGHEGMKTRSKTKNRN